MKTLLALASLAALGAIALLPLNFEIAVSALVASAIAAIALSDYYRRPLALSLAVAKRRTEKFGLAA